MSNGDPISFYNSQIVAVHWSRARTEKVSLGAVLSGKLRVQQSAQAAAEAGNRLQQTARLGGGLALGHDEKERIRKRGDAREVGLIVEAGAVDENQVIALFQPGEQPRQ